MEICHFISAKDLHQYLLSIPQRNLERIFAFTKKKKKEDEEKERKKAKKKKKLAFSICFLQVIIEAMGAFGSQKGPGPAPFWKLHTASLPL